MRWFPKNHQKMISRLRNYNFLVNFTTLPPAPTPPHKQKQNILSALKPPIKTQIFRSQNIIPRYCLFRPRNLQHFCSWVPNLIFKRPSIFDYLFIFFTEGRSGGDKEDQTDQASPKTQGLKSGCTGIPQAGTLESKPFAPRGLDS